MASTNKTEKLNLSQFLGDDIPSWLTDYNGDMAKIDDGVRALDPNGKAALAGGIMEAIYPVGSIYMAMNNQSPNDLFSFGTWERIASGRVLVGVDENDTDFNLPEQTGGEKDLQKHKHAGSSLVIGGGSHNHGFGIPCGTSGGSYGFVDSPNASSSGTRSTHHSITHNHTVSGETGETGTGGAQNLQPYLTCYIWTRTA